MWRCLSNVIESGFDHFNGPEGFTRYQCFYVYFRSNYEIFAINQNELNNKSLNLFTLYSVLKNYLFKIGFQGAFGNVWNAILDLPEVYV